jgi:ribonuclease T2
LSRAHNGKSVIVTCESNVLSRVGYPFEVIGSFQTGTFQPADYVGGPTNCPEQVSYQPKISGTGGGGENKSPNIEDVDYRDEL